MHVVARERAQAEKVWSEGAESGTGERHTPWACEAHVLSTKISTRPALRTLQNRF